MFRRTHTLSARILNQSYAIVGLVVLLIILSHGTKALAASANGASSDNPCAFSSSEFNPATNVRAIENYNDAIEQLLRDTNFATLDCIADAARSGKTRFSGGAWTLHNFYFGLMTPRPGHPTEEDWHEHMQLVQQWRDKYPQSISARIALAKAYIGYAWDARGKDNADTVSQSGWRLFRQRLAQAKTILNDAASTPGKDPEWYYAMQQISLGQGWDDDESDDLFKQAIAFEPQYYYYLQMRARYLQPQWHGAPGDSERIIKAQADKVTGDDGDILYFLTAVGICGCSDPDLKDFAWPRLQKGYTALEMKYGPSLVNTNYAAFMALKANDLEVADAMFKRIGDNWDEDVWTTHEWFQQNRDFADEMAPILARVRIFRERAVENLKSAGGQTYHDEVEATLTRFEQSCVTAQSIASPRFQIFVEIDKDGIAKDLHVEGIPNPMAMCMMKNAYVSDPKKVALFPAPPKAPYAVVVDIDPAALKTASK